MNNIRELLIDAARAAGATNYNWRAPNPGWESDDYGFEVHFGDGLGLRNWYPLTNNDHARQLVVLLQLIVRNDLYVDVVAVSRIDITGVYEKYNGNLLAANRLAIVRAAAEIARTQAVRTTDES